MLPAWAREYIGLPFKYGGRDRHGVDCYGLVLLVLNERFGLLAPDYAYDDPPGTPALNSMFAQGMLETIWTRCTIPRLGDVILLKTGGLPMHCGIVITPNRMLHAMPQTASCLERFDTPSWSHRLRGFFRHGGMIDA